MKKKKTSKEIFSKIVALFSILFYLVILILFVKDSFPKIFGFLEILIIIYLGFGIFLGYSLFKKYHIWKPLVMIIMHSLNFLLSVFFMLMSPMGADAGSAGISAAKELFSFSFSVAIVNAIIIFLLLGLFVVKLVSWLISRKNNRS
jgi:hypothetical protein